MSHNCSSIFFSSHNYQYFIIMFVRVNIIQRKLRGASQVPTNPDAEFDLLINYSRTHPIRSVTLALDLNAQKHNRCFQEVR